MSPTETSVHVTSQWRYALQRDVVLLSTLEQIWGKFVHSVGSLILTQFDFGVLRQQDVLAFNVPVDDFVLVKMSQTLQRRDTEKLIHWNPITSWTSTTVWSFVKLSLIPQIKKSLDQNFQLILKMKM